LTRNYSEAKKRDYYWTMVGEVNACKVRKGCYEAISKGGEVYYVDVLPEDQDMPGDDRPRNICPGSSNKHGAATYL